MIGKLNLNMSASASGCCGAAGLFHSCVLCLTLGIGANAPFLVGLKEFCSVRIHSQLHQKRPCSPSQGRRWATPVPRLCHGPTSSISSEKL